MDDQNIVDGLQNLRVVAAYDLAVMDDLARDFANALEDFPMTVRLRSGANEHVRRRRFRKRRQKGTLPECSDSDSDHEKMITNDSSNKRLSDSDSDDMEFFTRPSYSLSRFPAISSSLLVESDSVTDCLPQNQPPRRRRLLKKMNADDIKDTEDILLKRPDGLSKDLKCKIKLLSSINPDHQSILGCIRKRKRSVRENRMLLEASDIHGETADILERLPFGRLLSPCSCRSDVENTTEEERERDADDEQSDFYFESDLFFHPGPPYKFPALSPPGNLPNNQPNRQSGRQKEMNMRRHIFKNHVLRHFLDEKVKIAPNGRLFIPAKRRLVDLPTLHQSESMDGTVDHQGTSHATTDMDTNVIATPLSSPPLHCHKRHKPCLDAATHQCLQLNGRSLNSYRGTRKKKILQFVSGWLTTTTTC